MGLVMMIVRYAWTPRWPQVTTGVVQPCPGEGEFGEEGEERDSVFIEMVAYGAHASFCKSETVEPEASWWRWNAAGGLRVALSPDGRSPLPQRGTRCAPARLVLQPHGPRGTLERLREDLNFAFYLIVVNSRRSTWPVALLLEGSGQTKECLLVENVNNNDNNALKVQLTYLVGSSFISSGDLPACQETGIVGLEPHSTRGRSSPTSLTSAGS